MAQPVSVRQDRLPASRHARQTCFCEKFIEMGDSAQPLRSTLVPPANRRAAMTACPSESPPSFAGTREC